MKYYFKKNILAIIISSILVALSLIFTLVINDVGFSESDLVIKQFDVNLRVNKDGSGTFDNYVTYDFDDNEYTVIYYDVGDEKGTVFGYQDINGTPIKMYDNEKNDRSQFDIFSFKTRIFEGDQEVDITQIGYSFNGDVEMDEYSTGVVKSPYDNCERVYCYNEDGFKKNTKFNYQYRIQGMTTKYNDIGIINWILSPQTEVFIKNVSVNITFENELTNEYVEHLKNNFYVHGNIRYYDLEITNEGISFNVKKQKSSQLVEVRMGFNVNLVNEDEVISKNRYDYNAQEYLDKCERLTKENFEANRDRYFLHQTTLIVLTIVLISLIVLCWIRAYKKYDKERVSTFDSEYYRELPDTYPPAELGYLYNFKDTSKDDLSATIMDLIRKGYIELDTNGCSTTDKKPNYIYRLNKDKDQTILKSYERFVLKWYFEHIAGGYSLSLDEIDDYLKKEENAKRYLDDNKTFINLVREESRKHKFFDEIKNINYKFTLLYVGLGIAMMYAFMIQISNYYTFGLVFSSIFLAGIIVFASYISTIKRRSEKGNEDYVRWKAFRNFLLEFGRFEDYTMPLIEIWEHYMVYAVSFGIAEEVEKQMRLHFKSMGEDRYEYYVSSSNVIYYRPYIYVSHSCNNAPLMARSTISQAQAARASKSGGSGGSFGGGRSFGGGGGGFGGR